MNDIFKIAEEKNIEICYFKTQKIKAFSLPNSIILNPHQITNTQEEKEIVAHEMGHQETGSFYRSNSKYENKMHMEEKAKRWAVQKLISAAELKNALENGYTQIWQLAEYFDVSEDFMQDAIRIHKAKGNI